MSSLRTAVSKGFEALSLLVEGDRNALTVTDGVDGQKLMVRVDENERVVRVEGVICYPVDDFPAELSKAMDWLNRARGGVCFAYDSSQRALVVSTCWTSPNREPTPNQLHLLVALVQEACGRDGPQLERVAEGEAGWEAVSEGEPQVAPAPAPPARGTGARARGRLEDLPTRNLDDLEEGRSAPPPGDFAPRATTKFMGSADGEDFDFSPVPSGGGGQAPASSPRPSGTNKATRRFEELEELAQKGAAAEDETIDESNGPGTDTKRRMQRQALQMAVQRSDNRETERQDMTRAGRSPVRRFFRGLVTLSLIGGVGYGVFVFFVEPFFPNTFTIAHARQLLGLDAPPIDPKVLARGTMTPRELLLAELTDPMAEPEVHAAYLRTALDGLADQAGAALEQLVLDSPSAEVRAKAYALWADEGHSKGDEGRMRLLQGLTTRDRNIDDPADPSFKFLLVSVKTNAPSDKALIAALPWAKGQVFVTVVDLLGKPEQGAEERSKALAKYLDKDTPAFNVLNAMVATGFGPPDAAARLVVGKGLEWARGEGKPMLTGFVQTNAENATPLLKSPDEEQRLLALDLLVGAATPAATEKLARALTDGASRVRVRAARGLGTIASADAAWPLAQALARTETSGDQDFQDECRRAMGKLPATESVQKLKEHLAPALPVRERYDAVVALGSVPNAGGVPALVDALKDPDARVRRKTLETCESFASTSRAVLGQGLATIREVALRDPDAGVKQAAARLYRALTGKDPS